MTAHKPDKTEVDVVVSNASTMRLRVAEWLLREAKARYRRHRYADEAKRILGIRGGADVAYRSASVHSLTHGDVHPDNLDPLLALLGEEMRRGANPTDSSVDLEVLQRLEVEIGQSQVRFGSPTSDGGTRVLFGYEEAGAENRLKRRTAPMELPFYWELDDVGERKARRFVRGYGLTERPMWRIVESDGTPHVPQVSGPDQLLTTDYLLVTRVRNYLGDNWAGGNFVVSFGGAHGTGTRAVELLANDERELAATYEELKRLGRREGRGKELPACFQLLYEVAINFGDEQTGSYGEKIRLVGGELIPDLEEGWKQAARAVQPALEKWQQP